MESSDSRIFALLSITFSEDDEFCAMELGSVVAPAELLGSESVHAIHRNDRTPIKVNVRLFIDFLL